MEGEERSTALVVMIVVVVAVVIIFLVFAFVLGDSSGEINFEMFGSYAKALVNLFN